MSSSKFDQRPSVVESVLRKSFGIVFTIFVLALAFSVLYGLYLVWNPKAFFTEFSARVLGTALIIVFASIFYAALCDAWLRITQRNK